MKAKIYDDDGNLVEIDVKKFYRHLLKYHEHGTSIHEENGHYFRVDNQFRDKIKKLLKN